MKNNVYNVIVGKWNKILFLKYLNKFCNDVKIVDKFNFLLKCNDLIWEKRILDIFFIKKNIINVIEFMFMLMYKDILLRGILFNLKIFDVVW